MTADDPSSSQPGDGDRGGHTGIHGELRDPVESAAETMLWYLEHKGPLPQITAYRIIRDMYGPRCVAKGSRSLDPDVLRAFKELHGGEVQRVGQVWYLRKDLEDREEQHREHREHRAS